MILQTITNTHDDSFQTLLERNIAIKRQKAVSLLSETPSDSSTMNIDSSALSQPPDSNKKVKSSSYKKRRTN
ncbi:hypothetical protein QCA50_014176 [Cerrena zonata]|uniref:Uncharacterized protein n=1 Tax=Cerrena zonata TaxID=2478898 RepID=A0AAW0FRS7_9APHY